MDPSDLDAVGRPLETIFVGSRTMSWVKWRGKVRIVVIKAYATCKLWRAARQHMTVLRVTEWLLQDGKYSRWVNHLIKRLSPQHPGPAVALFDGAALSRVVPRVRERAAIPTRVFRVSFDAACSETTK